MSKPTPGPWREGQSGNMRVYGPEGAGGLIANVFGGRDNVRLIAAAPELLVALKHLVGYIADDTVTIPARAAIAKAEGRS